MPGHTLLLKRNGEENKKPLPEDLEFGELAMNYFDGNIFFRNSNNSLIELNRLDASLNNANIISISYNEDGDVLEVLYSTGNKTVFNYDENANLISIFYLAQDSETHLYTQILEYNSDNDLIGTNWEEV